MSKNISMHLNKRIPVFKSSEDLGHKQIQGLYSKSNNGTLQVIDKEIEQQRGERLTSIRTEMLLHNLTPSLLFVSLNSTKQSNMYISIVQKTVCIGQ